MANLLEINRAAPVGFRMHPVWYRILIGALSAAAFLAIVAGASGQQIDGFIEPYRSVDVAAAEMGIIAELKVREGDAVQKGQVLAVLDNQLQQALLAIARKKVEARGQLESARAELAVRAGRLEKLEALLARGHARPDEVERARADVAIAEANVLGAEEEQALRRLEHKRIETQLQRRSVVAPIDGVVTQVYKEEGEYVAPTDPNVLHMVQLDRLLAVFSVPGSEADGLAVGYRVSVDVGTTATPAEGEVEYVAPVTDAESGTVRVKVRLENSDGARRSGQCCRLQLPDRLAEATGAEPPASSHGNARPEIAGTLRSK